MQNIPRMLYNKDSWCFELIELCQSNRLDILFFIFFLNLKMNQTNKFVSLSKMFQDLIFFFVFGHLFLSKFQKFKYLLNKHLKKHVPYHSAAKCKKMPIWIVTITFWRLGGVDYKMEMEEMQKSQKIASIFTQLHLFAGNW